MDGIIQIWDLNSKSVRHSLKHHIKTQGEDQEQPEEDPEQPEDVIKNQETIPYLFIPVYRWQ